MSIVGRAENEEAPGTKKLPSRWTMLMVIGLGILCIVWEWFIGLFRRKRQRYT